MAGRDSALFPRFAATLVAAALQDTPVVMVNGPRQSGKTTLVRGFAGADRTYVDLDDDTVLAAARSDPTGFIRGHVRAVFDEVQRAPELLRAIKVAVDRDRRPGRYLLTGSANVLTLPTVSESLAGRMEVVRLLPLSRAEVHGKRPAFIERAFTGAFVKPREHLVGDELVRAVLAGGYPEMLRRSQPQRRQTWAREYVNAIVQRDVRDVADVEKLDRLPRLVRMLAHHSGQLTNFIQIGGKIALDDKTARKYVAILEQLFLVQRLEPWSRNRAKRLVKTPKLHFLDSGLLASVLGVSAERIAQQRSALGAPLETFVFSELAKQVAWLDQAFALHHYRDKDQDEVDFVIEADDGAVAGVEVKAAATVTAGDFKGLRKLASAAGKDFRLGVVLYDGEAVVPFGERLWAGSVACLWG
jgi:predicted AAA+ superfamily ATPase